MPLKKGSRREWTAKTFGAANRATKVTAAPIYGNHWETTRGTPMLPRDLMIALMYGRAFALEMPDGTEMWSMQSRNDVSRSLDVLGKTQGAFLTRGEKFWEAKSFSKIGAWTLDQDITISAPTAAVDIVIDPDLSELMIAAFNISASVNSVRALRFSTDHGASYWSGSGDYLFMRESGELSSFSDIGVHSTASTLSRSFYVTLPQLTEHSPLKPVEPISRPGFPAFFAASDNPVTNIRVFNRSGGNLTSGRILTWRK
jgi:hypothetical protein